MHKDITVDDNAKKIPETIFSYNEANYGVILDQMAKKDTCRTGTQRESIHSFQNTLTWLLSTPGFSTKRLSMRTFLKKTLSALWQRSWIIYKCRSEMEFQVKNHSLLTVKTTHL